MGEQPGLAHPAILRRRGPGARGGDRRSVGGGRSTPGSPASPPPVRVEGPSPEGQPAEPARRGLDRTSRRSRGVVVAAYVPARGDLIWLQFTPQAGHEQAGHRPAVVISPSSYNRRVGLALCCPVTSHVKGYPFEVLVPPGIGVEGAILSDQIKSLDWRVRKARRIGTLPAEVLQETVGKIVALVDPNEAR